MAERSRLTRSSRPALAVLLHGALAGHVYQSANRKLVFQYGSEWSAQAGAFPLSLSMPLTKTEHGHSTTSAFLWGLLPEDPRVIEFWARQHGIARTNVVALLAHVGEDCAGAVQITTPERLPSVLGAPTEDEQRTSVEWLSKRDLAWNEHACLQLARELGLAAARSTVQKFGSETAIVVERYDRVRANGIVTRVHQEDMCQALAIQPTVKYETDGGPTITSVAALLSRHSSEPLLDVAHFIEANVFNWLIAAPDAHAKNYSILHAAGPEHRLAPLYDVITALPYSSFSQNGITLAMSVGGERRVQAITGNHWRTVARAVELPARALLDRIAELGTLLPGAIDRVLRQHAKDKEAQAIITRLLEPIGDHVKSCVKRL
jgi:serine/threonine-protein kinase HipA